MNFVVLVGDANCVKSFLFSVKWFLSITSSQGLRSSGLQIKSCIDSYRSKAGCFQHLICIFDFFLDIGNHKFSAEF